MIAVADYGVGNLFSLKSSLEYIGQRAIVTGDAGVISQCERIILPGVGAFADAAEKLRSCGLDRVIEREAANGKPLLGICLGMQLLFEESHEYGIHRGLGLIPGRVVELRGVIPESLLIPHIGWNSLSFPQNKEKSRLYKNTNEGECVYFVHSYWAEECEEYTSATAEYGAPITASVENKNVYGTQYHPEKSGETGLKILKAFCEI